MRFTYRKEFQAMTPYNWLTSDSGWGCMLRSAQMLMACAMSRHHLGSEWRVSNQSFSNNQSRNYTQNNYDKVIRMFLDFPGDSAHMYALHNMVQCGIKYDKLPGEWFGPSTAALVLRDLSRLQRRMYDGPLEVVATQGGTVYVSEVEKVCCLAPYQHMTLDGSRHESISTDQSKSEMRVPSADVYQHSSKQFTVEQSMSAVSTTSDSEDHKGNQIQQNSPVHSEVSNASDSYKSQPTSSMELMVDGKMDEILRSRRTKGSRNILSKKSNLPINMATFDPLCNPPPVIEKPWQCALVLLLPLRLGESVISASYVEELKEHLQSPYSIGFVGGKVNHALYFVGYSQKSTTYQAFLGLDPHTCYANPKYEDVRENTVSERRLIEDIVAAGMRSSSVNVSSTVRALSQRKASEFSRDLADSTGGTSLNHALQEAETATKHKLPITPNTAKTECGQRSNNSLSPITPSSSSIFPSTELINQIHVSHLDEIESKYLDPSLAIGYYFRTREEFNKFCAQINESNKTKLAQGITPLFHIENAPPVEYQQTQSNNGDGDVDVDSGLALDRPGSPDDDDDYVFV